MGWSLRRKHDTGLVDLSHLLVNATGVVQAQRVGRVVAIYLKGVTPTADLGSGETFITLPDEFRARHRIDLPIHAVLTSPTVRSSFIFASGGWGVWSPMIDDRYFTTLTYIGQEV